MRQLESTRAFMRPLDLGRTKRNHRQVQARRALAVAANTLLVALVALALLWAVRHTREDARFEIRRIEAIGAKHTSRQSIEAAVARYAGTNLFDIDIDRVGSEVRTLPWVASVAIEKKLPDTLVVHVTEREPVALALAGGRIRYVDREGVVFADALPEAGSPELPLVSGAPPEEMKRTVEFLDRLRQASPELYSRVSEITPVDVSGFSIFDRDLRTTVLVSPGDAAEKWRALYGIAAASGYGPQSIEYADLRFHDRVVVKPRRLLIARDQTKPVVSGAITN